MMMIDWSSQRLFIVASFFFVVLNKIDFNGINYLLALLSRLGIDGNGKLSWLRHEIIKIMTTTMDTLSSIE